MRTLRTALLTSALVACTVTHATLAADYAIGADLSFLTQAEDHGTIFKDGTNA